MYKELLLIWLSAQGVVSTLRGHELVFKCPSGQHKDSNPSFSVNTVNGLGHCFSCGFSTHANKLLDIKPDSDTFRLSKYLSLNRLWEDQENEDEPPSSIELPPIDFYIDEPIRGIDKTVLKALGVYYCSHGRYKGRLIFPVRDYIGNLLGFDAREYHHPDRPDTMVSDNTKHAKYLRPSAMKTMNVLYPLDYLWKYRDSLDLSSVVLVEGIMDAISYVSMGVPAVANFGLGIPTAQKASYLLAMGVQEISNGFDNDKAGVEGWQKIKEEWRTYLKIGKPHELTRRIWASEYKDANEFIEGMYKA